MSRQLAKGAGHIVIASNAVLLIVDVQVGFLDKKWGKRNNPLAEQKMSLLLEHWRKRQMPVYHAQHISTDPTSPLRSGQAGVEIQEIVRPLYSELVFKKHVNSVFIGTDLEQSLKQNKCRDIVIVGLTTDHCISTTARMAENLGFNVFVIEDATATFERQSFDGEKFSADEIHRAALASLHQEFATILNSGQIKTLTDKKVKNVNL